MSARLSSRRLRQRVPRSRQEMRRQKSLQIESLESRGMMAAYVWQGTVSSDWDNPANWNLASGVPDDTADTVTINTGTPFSPQLSVARTIGSLAGSGNLNLQGFRLTTNTTANTTFSGAISGSGGGLTKQGTGTLTLSGTNPNTYTGQTIVNAGVLLLSKTAGVDAVGSGGFSIITNTANAGVVRLAAANQIPDTAPIRVDAALSGGGANFDLANLSETVGPIFMRTITSSGTPPGSNVTIGTGTLTLNGDVTFEYDRNSTGNLSTWLAITGTGAGTLNLNGTRTFTSQLGALMTTPANVPGSDASISAIISNGTLVKAGDRGLVLTNSGNTYAGGTIINGGFVQVTADSQLGAAPGVATPANIVLNGGALLANATFTLNANRGIAVGPAAGAGSGTIQVASGFTLTYDGVVANNAEGTGGLLKTGAGQLTLGGTSPNTFTGVTTVDTGVLLLNKTAGVNAVGTGGVSIITATGASGVVRLGAANQIPDNAPIRVDAAVSNGNANFDLANLSETVGSIFMRTITSGGTPAGAAISIGTGTLTLNGDVTFEYDRNNTGNSSAWIAITGTGAGTLNLNGTRTFTSQLGALMTTPANFTGSDASISAIVANGKIIKAGSRGLVLSNSGNTFTGGIDVNAGNLIFNSAGALGATNVVNVASGASLTSNLGTAATISNTINVAAGGNINARNQALTLSTNTNLTAPIAAGLLKFNDDEVTTANIILPNAIAMVTDLTIQVGNVTGVNGGGQLQLTGLISDGGSGFDLTKTGTNSLRISNAANSYTGDTSILNGTIFVTGNIAPSTNGNLGNSATPIRIGDTSGTNTPGAGLFTDGTLTISRDIHVRAGSPAEKRIGIAGAFNATISGGIILDDDVTFQVNQNTLTVSSLLAGPNDITKTQVGTLLLTNTANSYTGTTSVLAGTLLLGGDAPAGGNSVVGNSTAPILLGNTTGTDSAALLTNGPFTLSRPIDVRAGSTGAKIIGGNSTSTSTINSVITLNDHLTLRQNSTGIVNIDSTLADLGGARNISKDGTGTVVLTSAQPYTGTTTISAGTLRLLGSATLGAGSAGTTVANGGTLDLSSLSSSLTESLRITGGGANSSGAIRSSAGVNTVAGDLTFAGSAALGASAGATLIVSTDIVLGPLDTLTITGEGTTTSTGDIFDSIFNGYAAGLLEGRITGAAFDITTANPGGIITNDPASGVALMGNRTIATSGTSQAQANHVWGTNETWIYTGQFFDADGSFAFAEDIDDSTLVKIDGITVLQNGVHNVAVTTGSTTGIGPGTPTAGANPSGGTTNFGMGPLGDGWHTIEIRFGNASGGAGSTGGSTGWTTSKGFGLRDNTINLTSADGNDYVIPVDPGNASLFRTPVDGSVLTRIIKAGTGTFRIEGTANDYRGIVEVRDGVLVATNTTSLGTTQGGTKVSNGGTLALENTSIAGEALQLNGVGAAGQSGALTNLSGNNTFGGPITVEEVSLGSVGIGSDAGTLTVPGDLDLNYSRLVLDGAGNVVLSGDISGGPATAITSGGLTGEFFTLNSTTSVPTLLDPATGANIPLDSLTPNATVLVPRIDFGTGTETLAGDGSTIDRAGSTGNILGGIGVSVGTDNIAGLFTGFINIPETGNYVFTVRNDDGARVWIDVNNDGDFDDPLDLVASRPAAGGVTNTSGTATTLTAGWHAIKVGWYEQTGGSGLQLSWQLLTGSSPFARRNIEPAAFGVGFQSDNSVAKLGSGTATLSGDNSYSGATTVRQGTLVAASNTALGDTAGNTVVEGGATLALDNSIVDLADNSTLDQSANLSIGDAIVVANPNESAVSAIRNVAGNNTLTGNISVDVTARLNVTSGLQLWLDAANMASVIAADGSLDDGDLISAWNDVDGGTAENAVQANAAKQPRWVANSLSGTPAIRFTPANADEANSDDMQIAGLPLGNNVSFFFIIQHAAQNTNSGSCCRPFFAGDGDALAAGIDHYAFSVLRRDETNNPYGFRVDMPGSTQNIATVTGVTNPEDGSFHLYSMTRDGTATNGFQVWKDGANIPGLTRTVPGNATDTTYSIGGQNNSAGGGARQYAGDIPEVIIFNRTLTAAERLEVEAYLNAKYFGGPVASSQAQGAARITSDAGTLSINGNVTFPELVVDGAGNTVVNGQLQNAGAVDGALSKAGAGTLSLNSANTYTGTTTVNQGTLQVNGSIADGPAASDVTVAAFATLAGTGTIAGTASLAASANLAPGNSAPGTLAFSGGLTFTSTSNYLVEINGDNPGDGFGSYDQVATASAPDLTGVALQATRIDTLANPYPFSSTANSGAVNSGDVYVILDNQSGSPVIGNFSGFAEGAEVPITNFPATLRAVITYTYNGTSGGSNDVALIVETRNTAPIIASNGNVFTNEPSATNSGTFNDLDLADNLIISVVSGPGSVSQSPGSDRPGSWTWTATGLDGPSFFTVTVRVSDGTTFTDTTFQVVVNNLPPSINAGGNASINEGSTFTRSGTVTDPSSLDTLTGATVDYGDGSGVQPLAVTAGSFNLSHIYADNGNYTVTITATDDDGGVGTTTFIVAVGNLAPVVDAGADASVGEGVQFARSGSISDPGTSDTFPSGTVNYGDGTGNQPLTIVGNTFQLNHVYADNGNYTVTITILDDDGTPGTDTLQITVNNAAPTAGSAGNQTVAEGVLFNLPTIAFNDLGTLDTHTAVINWGDGTNSAGVVTETPTGPPGNTAGMNGTVGGSHVYADDGTYTVTVTITDDDLQSTARTLQVVVSNANPVVVPRANVTINEGTTLNLGSSSFTDPGTLDTHTATVDWGIGGTVPATVTETPTGPPGNVAGMTGTLSASRLYDDNVGSPFTVNLIVTDDNGGSGTGSFSVTVNNVAPVMDPISGPSAAVPGQSLEYTFTATDVSAADEAAGFTFRIDWDGNGTVDQIVVSGPGNTSVTVSHVYTSAADRTIRVVAVDKDGGVSAVETQDVTVSQFVIDDNGFLVGAGTNSSDRVIFQSARGGLQVRMGNTYFGPFSVTERVIFYGLGGNDFIQMMPNAGLILEAYGGTGNDTLQGSPFDDTLYGEDGDDNLQAGLGNDSLDGGNGKDKIDGSAGDDWIFGGAGNDSITAGLGNDTANGGSGIDSISGLDGDDIIRGGDDGDVLSGGRGADIIFGNAGNDTIKGDDGNDILVGGLGVDSLTGGLMDDLLIGGDAGGDADVSLGNRDDDAMSDESLMLVLADWNSDMLLGVDSFLALGDVSYNDGNDRLWGNSGIDIFYSTKAEAQDETSQEEVVF